MTVYDDNFDDEPAKKFAEFLSKKLKTITMLIHNIDSDSMTIHLFKQTQKDFVVVGHPYDLEMEDEKPTHGKIEVWAPLAQNPGKLLEAFGQEYVFSEEVLNSMEEEIAIKFDVICMPYDYAKTDDTNYLKLNFTVDPKGKSALGETALVCCFTNIGDTNGINYCTFINKGRGSRGITIALYGKSIKNDSVNIDVVTLINRVRTPIVQGDLSNAIQETKKLETWHLTDGSKCLICYFDEFEIPEGTPVSSKEVTAAHTKREIVVTFIPKANKENRAFVTVLAIPMANREGGATSYSYEK